jgi:phospholipase/carboxylesterase|tara:strand:+ start:454 stop:1059 length:606 start_codon:yes stop_codon:yes gene_type:complete
MNKVVLFLHGYGANGSDLIGLSDHINNDDNSISFESPNAPESCPLNYFGYQWFSLADRTPEEIYSGLKISYNYLVKILDDLIVKYNTNHENIVIIGFSQGAMLASYYGLTSQFKMGGIISLSGALPKKILDDISSLNVSQKFFIFHGKSDSVVPSERSQQLYNFLSLKKIKSNLIIEENCDHEISIKAIEEINNKVKEWLK